MKKYTVLAETILSYSATVEAESFDEAYDIGKELPFEVFELTGDNFHVYDVDEID